MMNGLKVNLEMLSFLTEYVLCSSHNFILVCLSFLRLKLKQTEAYGVVLIELASGNELEVKCS